MLVTVLMTLYRWHVGFDISFVGARHWCLRTWEAGDKNVNSFTNIPNMSPNPISKSPFEHTYQTLNKLVAVIVKTFWFQSFLTLILIKDISLSQIVFTIDLFVVKKRAKIWIIFLKPIMFKTNFESCDTRQCFKHDFYLTLSNWPLC